MILIIKKYIEGLACIKKNKVNIFFYYHIILPSTLSIATGFQNECSTLLEKFSTPISLVFRFSTTLAFFIFQQISTFEEENITRKFTPQHINNVRKIKYVFNASILNGIVSLIALSYLFLDEYFQIRNLFFNVSLTINQYTFNKDFYYTISIFSFLLSNCIILSFLMLTRLSVFFEKISE